MIDLAGKNPPAARGARHVRQDHYAGEYRLCLELILVARLEERVDAGDAVPGFLGLVGFTPFEPELRAVVAQRGDDRRALGRVRHRADEDGVGNVGPPQADGDAERVAAIRPGQRQPVQPCRRHGVSVVARAVEDVPAGVLLQDVHRPD